MALNLEKIGRVIEKYMMDEVTVVRPEDDADASIDPTTLEITVTTTEVYSGQALVSAMGSPATVDVGGAQARVTYEVALPVGDEIFEPNDILTVTTAANDPALEGKQLIITGMIPTTLVTHRRLSAYLDDPAS